MGVTNVEAKLAAATAEIKQLKREEARQEATREKTPGAIQFLNWTVRKPN